MQFGHAYPLSPTPASLLMFLRVADAVTVDTVLLSTILSASEAPKGSNPKLVGDLKFQYTHVEIPFFSPRFGHFF